MKDRSRKTRSPRNWITRNLGKVPSPLRLDPAQLTTLRGQFLREIKSRFAKLRRIIQLVIGKTNQLEIVANVFCPTGPGGGVDPTCSPGEEKRRDVFSETTHEGAEILLTQGVRPDFKREREVKEFAPGAGLERGGLYVAEEGAFSKGTYGKVRLHLNLHEDNLDIPQEMKQLGYEKGKEVAGQQSLDYVLRTENGGVTIGEIPPSAFHKVEVYEAGKWISMGPKEYLASRDIVDTPRLPSMAEYEKTLRDRADELGLHERNIQQSLTDYNRAGLADKVFLADDLGIVSNVTVNAEVDLAAATSSGKVKRFRAWLRDKMDSTLAGDALLQEYIERAHQKGVSRSYDETRAKEEYKGTPETKVGAKEEFLRGTYRNRGVIDEVKLLAGRTFAEMEDVNNRMATKMSRALADGFVRGLSAEEIAATMVDEVDIEMNRAVAIARTECLPGDTLVSAAVVRTVFRRWYVGPMVEVVTSNGRKFSATPNHPMLTKDGWILAGMLKNGDNLICRSREKDTGSTSNENVQGLPASLSQIFNSLEAVGVVERKRGGEPDFHGDGMNGEVEVLVADRELRIGNFSSISQPLAEQVFSPAGFVGSTFCSSCGRLLSINKQICFCSSTKGDSSRIQSVLDKVPVNSQTRGDGDQGLATGVPVNDVVNINVVSELIPYSTPIPRIELGSGDSPADAELSQNLTDPLLVIPSYSGDLPLSKAAQVEFDNVLLVTVREFAGHVYNLETPFGYYAIDGLYTGNTTRAHSEGQLTGFERLGVTALGAKVEWATQGSSGNVCPKCRHMEGKVFKIKKARGMLPLHPNCSCAWSEVIVKAKPTRNVFCPTGKGGGIDPTCSPPTREVEIHDPRTGEVYWKGKREDAERLLKEQSEEEPDHGLEIREGTGGYAAQEDRDRLARIKHDEEVAERIRQSELKTGHGLRPGHEDYVAPPETLYHATFSADKIREEGFKSGAEVGHQTLGGSAEHLVSFTTKDNAEEYTKGLAIARRGARGELSDEDLQSIGKQYGVKIDRAALSIPASPEDKAFHILQRVALEGRRFPLFMGGSWPAHLKDSPEPSIVSVKSKDIKDIYYNPGEKEWRVADYKNLTVNQGEWTPFEPARNVFCPTGKGGGKDNSCGKSKTKDKAYQTTDDLAEQQKKDWEFSSPLVRFYEGVHLILLKDIKVSQDIEEDRLTRIRGLIQSKENLPPGVARLPYPMEEKIQLLDGNHRYLAAKKEGHTHVPVIFVKSMADRLPKNLKRVEKIVGNVFCPTGPGGGVDATCSTGGKTNKKDRLNSLVETARKGLTDGIDKTGKATLFRDLGVLSTTDALKVAKQLELPDHLSSKTGVIQHLNERLKEPSAKPAPTAIPSIDPTSPAATKHLERLVKKMDNGINPVHLGDLREATGWAKEQFETAIHAARKAGILSLTPHEGRHGSTERDRASAIYENAVVGEGNQMLLYASLRNTNNSWTEFEPTPIENVFCPTGKGGGVDASCSPASQSKESNNQFLSDLDKRLQKNKDFDEVADRKSNTAKFISGDCTIFAAMLEEEFNQRGIPSQVMMLQASDDWAPYIKHERVHHVVVKAEGKYWDVVGGNSEEFIRGFSKAEGDANAKLVPAKTEDVKDWLSRADKQGPFEPGDKVTKTYREMFREVMGDSTVENVFCPTGKKGGVDPSCSLTRTRLRDAGEHPDLAKSKFIGARVDGTIHDHAEGVKHEVAKMVGGIIEEDVPEGRDKLHPNAKKVQKDKKRYDVKILGPKDRDHDIEVKSMSVGSKKVLSVHDDALLRKVDHIEVNPSHTFHTVCVDDRETFNDRANAANYSGNRLYYKRGSGRYALSQMHAVRSEAELKRLVRMPDDALPEKARGSLPPPPPLEKLRESAAKEEISRNARNKIRKSRPEVKERLKEQSRERLRAAREERDEVSSTKGPT